MSVARRVRVEVLREVCLSGGQDVWEVLLVVFVSEDLANNCQSGSVGKSEVEMTVSV